MFMCVFKMPKSTFNTLKKKFSLKLKSFLKGLKSLKIVKIYLKMKFLLKKKTLFFFLKTLFVEQSEH